MFRTISSLLAAVQVVLVVLPIAARASITSIDWASTVSSTIPSAGNGLGQPDGVLVNGSIAPSPATAVYGGFGSGANNNYTSAALAALLGVNTTQLALADFIFFEVNGTPGSTVESNDLIFSDGINSLTVSHTFGGSAGGPILALGNISLSAYASFFGFANPFVNGEWVYELIDVDGFSSVDLSAPGFSATLNSLNSSPSSPDSPDPDALGRIATAPEASALTIWTLLTAGAVGSLRCGRRRDAVEISDSVLEVPVRA
jgi:hypothetical protein